MMGEDGEAKLVIMSVEEYQRLLLGKLQRQVEDVEKINQQIIEAQLKESAPEQEVQKPVRVPRAPSIPRVDLRAEVIDPSFDFEGPKADFDDL